MGRTGTVGAAIAAAILIWAPQTAIAAGAATGQATDAAAVLSDLTALDRRVAAIGYRLATANADLCPATAPQSGVVMHAASQYGPRLRPAMLESVGAWSGPVLLAVAPGSPAERGGLAAGDRLIGIGELRLQTSPLGEKSSFDEVRRARDELAQALTKGPVMLKVDRAGQVVEAPINPATGCQFQLQVDPGKQMNAAADGKNIFISSALASYARTDGELALIVAHELAHNIMRARSVEPKSPRAKERAADRIGLYLMRRAGYDIDSSMDLWRRLGRDNPLLNLLPVTHPSPSKRAKDLVRVRAEILLRESEGRPLIPADLEKPMRTAALTG